MIRAALRLPLGFAIVMLVAVAWVSPGEAHEGHAGAGAGHAAPASKSSLSEVRTSVETVAAQPAAPSPERSGTACCGQACHAAMKAGEAFVPIVGNARVEASVALDAAPQSNPPPHLRRPPRPTPARAG